MTNPSAWSKSCYQKAQRNWKTIGLFLVLPLLILGLSLYFGLKVFQGYQTKPTKLQPRQIINVSEPFTANLYFNDELGTDTFSQIVIKDIDAAQHQVELAMYSMDDLTIRDALYRAANRGVIVNLVFSDKHPASLDNLFSKTNKNLRISYIFSSNNGSMHHKLLLIDRRSPGQKILFGTYNFTKLQAAYDPSFLLETERPEVVDVFGAEFARLASGLHGGKKFTTDYSPFAALIHYPNGYLEIWFSPGQAQLSVKNRMLELIKSATKNIKIMIWDMTDKDVASELVATAKHLPVSMLTDDSNWSSNSSVFPDLAAQKQRENLNNLELIHDTKNTQIISKIFKENDLNSFLHQHLMIVDDTTAVFGTNNWSANGFSHNDEAVMVSNIPTLVQPFEQSYLTNYNRNK
jgi:phosphatidylserine/phosphatidylglycerophosphate/cardiolipin synthase-like enzyme